MERINPTQYNGLGELFYSFIGFERIPHNTILPITILNLLNSYEEKKELRNFRAVQRFFNSVSNRNIKRITERGDE